jgi:hypothetical protein
MVSRIQSRSGANSNTPIKGYPLSSGKFVDKKNGARPKTVDKLFSAKKNNF